MSRQYSELDIEVMLGLDDLAHNRLYTMEGDGSFTPVGYYGTRNRNEECYCKLLRKLKVQRD